MTLKDLANQRREMKFDDHDLYLGLSGQLNWKWANGNNVSTTYNMWGPGEPSGDGKCGSFLNAISWDSAWKGYGWRWNDEICTNLNGYLCEEPLGGLADNSYVKSRTASISILVIIFNPIFP